MFGYVVADPASLSESDQARYQAVYCGLCREIGERSGRTARLCLAYDFAFLILLLGSLYEPEIVSGQGRCFVHPGRRGFSRDCFTRYAADMNVYLSCCKAQDDAADEGSLRARVFSGVLAKSCRRIENDWPRQCGAVHDRLRDLAIIERERRPSPDDAANLFGELMGELFVYDPADHWSPTLRSFGEGLGRFVYLMDAAVDLEQDRRTGSYNPLALSEFSALDMRGTLTLLMGEAARYFEILPLERDLPLLRNILYRGVWQKYDRAYPPPEKEPSNDR